MIPINQFINMKQLCIRNRLHKENIPFKWKNDLTKSLRNLLEYNLIETSTKYENLSDVLYNLTNIESENSQPTNQVECYPFHNFIDFLNRYYIPFIIMVGLIGNTLSFLVFMTSYLKLRSSSYFMAALAAADFGFLSMLLMVYLSNETKLEIFNKPGWCQWLVYVSSTCSVLSAWYIVAFTTERFIAVEYPLQRPFICTVRRAKIIITSLAAIALSAHIYTFWTAGIIPTSLYSVDSNSTNPLNISIKIHSRKEACGLRYEYENLMFVINIIDTFVSLIIPVVSIVAMNTMLARNLFLFRQRFIREEMFNEESVTNSAVLPNNSGDKVDNLVVNNLSHQQHRHRSNYPLRNMNSHGRNNPDMFRCIRINSSGRNSNALSLRNQQNITKTLLLISTVYICLNIPSYALRIYVFFFFSLWRQQAPEWLWCLQQMFMAIYYTHFSVNFLLYAIGGATFRRCLANILSKLLMKFSHYGRRSCPATRPNQQQNSSNVNDIKQQSLRGILYKK